jgi:hypothetical protein
VIQLNYKFNVNDNIITKLIFNIWMLFFNYCLLSNFFVYTYYITFYVILIDIYIISKYTYKLSNNEKIKEYSIRLIILISIVLIHIPIPAMLFFYNIHKKWMNKVIIVLLCLIFLLMIVLCYYSKIFLIIFLFIISILVFLLIIYIGNETTNKIIHKYKFLVSLIISIIIYYFNNI